ncbi:MAG: hypothetical protein II978_03095 [Clostridia bacterium]|nr:hypothetical protein [Clostridia bacterium]
MSKVDKMYDAVQELICAFVVNQEAVEKAKTQKKSMLKAYQDRDKDLESAFKDCLDVINSVKEEKEETPSGLKEFLLDTARYYSSESSLHMQEIDHYERELENACNKRDIKRIEDSIKTHRKGRDFYHSKMAKAMEFANSL